MFQTRRVFDQTYIGVFPSDHGTDWQDWCSAALQWTLNGLNSPMIDPSCRLSIADICSRFHAPASHARYGKYRKFVDRWRELGMQMVVFEYTTNNPVDLVISATIASQTACQTFIIVDLPKRFWDGLDDDGRLAYKLLGPAAVPSCRSKQYSSQHRSQARCFWRTMRGFCCS